MTTYHRFGLAVAATLLVAACGGKNDGKPAEKAIDAGTSAAIAGDDLALHIATLASDEFEGRAPGTPGGEKTRNYIISQYERIGLVPAGDSYLQKAPMVETTLDPATSYFRITGADGETRDLEYRKDAVFGSRRIEEHVSFEDSDLVFVGYGVVAPEYGWNDYEGLDVEGKTVVILVNDPGFATQDPDLFNGNAMTYYGRWTYKYEEASRQGATAAMVIHDTAPAAYGWGVVERSWSGPQLDLERPGGASDRVMAEGWFSNETAHALFAEAGLDLNELQAAAAAPGFKPVEMTGLKASASLTSAIRRSEDANVIGVLEGSERPDEYVLYMGHWDHLGVNPETDGDDKIFNGAIDNATGIAAILEIAEKFAASENRPKRSIIFAAVTAEESGLLGSGYMAEDPPVPLKQIVGGINIDALLPMPEAKDIIVVGHGASDLEDYLASAAKAHDRRLRPDAEPEKGYFYRSDHISFAKKGVPMLYADSGIDLREGGEEEGRKYSEDYTANRYHAPADEYDESWEMSGMVDLVEILQETGAALAETEDWPNWREGNEFRALRDAQRAGD